MNKKHKFCREDLIMTLKEIIDALTVGRKIHISIDDISGVLSYNKLKLPYKNLIHDTAFCNHIKNCVTTNTVCFTNKMRTTKFAARVKRSFYGECLFGVSEIVYPVVRQNKTLCVIYVGNICRNESKMEIAIHKAYEKVGYPLPESQIKFISTCEKGEVEQYLKMAKLIADFILEEAPENISCDTHWAIKRAIEFVNEYYTQDIHLNQIAEICHINAKYLGRIFKQKTGLSFREYLTEQRFTHVKKKLKSGNESITDIALSCGFEEITYFNHLFKQIHGISPTEYRKKNRYSNNT